MNVQTLKGYRTIIINVATVALLILTGLTSTITDPVYLRYIAMAIAAANLVLRYMTTTPVGMQPPVVVPKEGPPQEVTEAVAQEAAATGEASPVSPGDGV